MSFFPCVQLNVVQFNLFALNIIGGFAKATLLVSLLKTMFTQSIYFFIPFAIGFFTEYFVCMLRTTQISLKIENPRFVGEV